MELGSQTKKPYIICFGDSLTVGYQSPTPVNPEYLETPYGEYLQGKLGPNCWVLVSGLNGELTSEMVNRFRGDVLDRSPRYVIILGGTNDLGWNHTPLDIFNNLATMYDQALSEDIIPVAVTVPSLRPLQGMDISKASDLQGSKSAEREMIRSHIERRLDLNGQIREYCVSRQIPWVDLFSETTEAETQLLDPIYCNDGLHLSTRGYTRLADLLWSQVFQHGEF
jgi:lysophospholipase L1-like esterase